MSGARRDKQAGLLLDESLIFEHSSPGRLGVDLPDEGGAATDYLPAELVREPIEGFPEQWKAHPIAGPGAY